MSTKLEEKSIRFRILESIINLITKPWVVVILCLFVLIGYLGHCFVEITDNLGGKQTSITTRNDADIKADIKTDNKLDVITNNDINLKVLDKDTKKELFLGDISKNFTFILYIVGGIILLICVRLFFYFFKRKFHKTLVYKNNLERLIDPDRQSSGLDKHGNSIEGE